MKCPYNDFKECIIEQCPACNYETIQEKILEGRYPCWMDIGTAIKQGCAWYVTKTTYKFISCNLANNSIQPVPSNTQVINNSTSVGVSIYKKSIF